MKYTIQNILDSIPLVKARRKRFRRFTREAATFNISFFSYLLTQDHDPLSPLWLNSEQSLGVQKLLECWQSQTLDNPKIRISRLSIFQGKGEAISIYPTSLLEELDGKRATYISKFDIKSRYPKRAGIFIGYNREMKMPIAFRFFQEKLTSQYDVLTNLIEDHERITHNEIRVYGDGQRIDINHPGFMAKWHYLGDMGGNNLTKDQYHAYAINGKPCYITRSFFSMHDDNRKAS